MEEKVQAQFWLSSWFVIAALLLLPPVGIILMWISGEFKKNYKIILTVVTCLYAFFIFPLFITAVTAPFAEKEIPKREAIIGEWELSPKQSGGIDAVSNLKFDEDGGFMWLIPNGTGNKLLSGRYVRGDQISLIIGVELPVDFDYSIDDDVLKFDGLYYTRGEHLSFIEVPPVVTETAAAPPAVAEPVSIDLSAGVYTVGADVPPGKYDITATSGRGNFFGNPGIVNEIMGVGDENYLQTYQNATFKNGNTIEVKGTLVVNLTSK